MLTKVLLEISLWCFTSPHFDLKVERQHQSSAELAFDVIHMGSCSQSQPEVWC